MYDNVIPDNIVITDGIVVRKIIMFSIYISYLLLTFFYSAIKLYDLRDVCVHKLTKKSQWMKIFRTLLIFFHFMMKVYE